MIIDPLNLESGGGEMRRRRGSGASDQQLIETLAHWSLFFTSLFALSGFVPTTTSPKIN